MRKILALIALLAFALPLRAQHSLTVDDGGTNMGIIKAPTSGGTVIFTLPSTGGTLLTSASLNAWLLNGNTLTGTQTAPNEWFGSSSLHDVIFKANGNERFRIMSGSSNLRMAPGTDINMNGNRIGLIGAANASFTAAGQLLATGGINLTTTQNNALTNIVVTSATTGGVMQTRDLASIPLATNSETFIIVGPATAGLTNERVLAAGTGISLTDGGANGNMTLDNTGVLSVGGTAPIVSSGGQNPSISITTGNVSSTDLSVTGGGGAVTSAGLTLDINSNAVTYPKIQHAFADNVLLGSGNGGAGNNLGEITLGTGLSMGGTTLNVTGAPPTGTAGGDLFGSYPNPIVAKINGVTLDAGTTGAPTDGQVLVYNSALIPPAWEAVTPGGAVTLNATGTFSATPTLGGFATSTATPNKLVLRDGSAGFEAGRIAIVDQNEFRLMETTANGTDYMGFRAPASLTTSTTFTLPDGDGASGNVLSTDGAGTLSWVSNGALSGSGSANRVAFWNGTSSLSSNANLTYDGTTLIASNNSASAAAVSVGNNAGSSMALLMTQGNFVGSIDSVAMPTGAGATPAIAISGNNMITVITDNGVTGGNKNLTLPAGGHNGQILIVINNDNNQHAHPSVAGTGPDLDNAAKDTGMWIWYNGQWHRLDG